MIPFKSKTGPTTETTAVASSSACASPAIHSWSSVIPADVPSERHALELRYLHLLYVVVKQADYPFE